VDAPSLFSDKEAALLEALVNEGVDFLVVGLAAAMLQGAPAVTQDVDLWVAEKPRDTAGPGRRSPHSAATGSGTWRGLTAAASVATCSAI
jgi:hypothetical protein